MDAPAAGSGSPLPGVNPPPEQKKKKKKRKPKATTGSQCGRSVETKEPAQPSSLRPAGSADYQAFKTKQNDVLLQHRKICNQHKSKDQTLLIKSINHIKQYVEDNELYSFVFNYDPETGYSPESKIKVEAMATMKTMLDDHIKLFNNLRTSFSSHYNPRGGSGRMSTSQYNKIAGDQQKAKLIFWEHSHNMTAMYGELCKNRLKAYCMHLENMPAFPSRVDTYRHYETFISETLELINVQHKLLEEKKELSQKKSDLLKETKQQSEEKSILTQELKKIDEDIRSLSEYYNSNNKIMTSLLSQAVTCYCNTTNQQALTELISKNSEGFSKWIQQVNPEELSSFHLKQIINICIALGDLQTVQKLLDFLLLKAQDNNLDTTDVLSLICNCRQTFRALCENKESKENPKKLSQIKNIASTLNQIIINVIEHNDVSAQDQKSLNDIFEIEYQLPIHIVLLEFDCIMQTLNNTRLSLVVDEQQEALKARQKNEKLANNRKKRVEDAQRKQRPLQQEQAQAVALPMPVPTPDAEQPLPSAIIEALDAFTNKKSLREISDILFPLINNPATSKIHKAQALYCYADLVRVVLSRQVYQSSEDVCTVYRYGALIRQASSGSSTDQLPDREMLDKFIKSIKELSTSQSLFQLIESMTESFNQTVETITAETNIDPDFLEALDQLYTQTQVLTSNMNKIADCCTNAQIIYDERGKLLKTHLKGGKQGRKLVNDRKNIEQNIQCLESVGDQLNQCLKPLNDKLKSSKQLIDRRRLSSSPQQDSACAL